jgi:hypothetical protein
MSPVEGERGVSGGEDNRQLKEVLEARARGEVDFVMGIASALKVTWEDALATYPEVFKRTADAVLQRVAAARDRRRAR